MLWHESFVWPTWHIETLFCIWSVFMKSKKKWINWLVTYCKICFVRKCLMVKHTYAKIIFEYIGSGNIGRALNLSIYNVRRTTHISIMPNHIYHIQWPMLWPILWRSFSSLTPNQETLPHTAILLLNFISLIPFKGLEDQPNPPGFDLSGFSAITTSQM